MKKEPFVGNVLQNPKYKKQQEEMAAAYQASVENGAHADRLTRFNARQGHGYAAEQANHLLDKITGKDAVILGDDNAKNGPDRMVDGNLIQTKYCQSAAESVNAAFKNGQYRYIDSEGHVMQIEVPKDQYQDAIECMKKKIANGQVPGITDPEDAEKIVRQGNVDYRTACRIAKAGTIESLTFDAANGAVVAASAMGISSLITFAKSIWNGDDASKAIDSAMYSGLRSGGIAFAGSVLTAQLTRTSLNTVLMAPSIELVKLLPSSVRHVLVNSMRNGSFIYGNAATKNLAKLMRSNIIAAGAIVLVMSAGDITNFFQGRMSGKQLFKNVLSLTAGIGGGYAGAAAGGAIGILLGPAGAMVGTVAGGIIGGAVAGEGANKALSVFIEDDAEKMLLILNAQLIPLSQEYMLSEEELEIVLDDLKYELVHEKLLQMFASEDREEYAAELLTNVIENVIKWRVSISLPSNEDVKKGLEHVLEMSQHEGELQAYFAQEKVDTQAIGRELLSKEISEHASKKAWYVTRQMNTVSMMQKNRLEQMAVDEREFMERNRKDKQELARYKEEVERLLKEDV